MADADTPNYPDILGVVTKGTRKVMDCVQCAISSRPDHVQAGQAFEAVLLIQNMVDSEVDVHVELEVPQRDAKKKKSMFTAGRTRLLVGLKPAEVGYVTLPIANSPQTTPSRDYVLKMKLKVKKLSRQARQIRLPQGGGPFTKATLRKETLKQMKSLHNLSFSAEDGGKRNMIQDTFTIYPQKGPPPAQQKLKPQWVSIWSMRDHMDDNVIVERVQAELELLLPQMRRDAIFKPLLNTIQAHFKEAGYPLHVAEAVYITKAITLVVEQGVEQASILDPPDYPTWLKQVARTLLQDQRFANQPAHLVTKRLFPSILLDAILHAFVMVSTVTNENFGTEEETHEYADSIVNTLISGEQMDFARTYLPLIAAGVIANTRVTMPTEKVRDTLFMISRAMEQRITEKTEDNDFIFNMITSLVDRGLEHF